MRKRWLSVFLSALLLTMLLPACTGSKEAKFDLASFMEDDFYTVDYDDMLGQAYIQPAGVDKGEYKIDYDGFYTIGFEPFIYVDGSVSTCGITVSNTTRGGWVNFDKLVVKIDDINYIFSKLDITKLEDASYTVEFFNIFIDNNATSFMESIVEHQDEVIRVYIIPEEDTITFNFVLSEEMKAGIAKTFEQYEAAGGTSKANMKIVTNGVKKDKLQKFKTEKAD